MSAFAVLEKTLTIPRTANASKVFFNCKNVGISMLLREKDLNLQGPIGLEDGLLQPGLVGKSVAGQVRARYVTSQTNSLGRDESDKFTMALTLKLSKDWAS